MHPSERARDFRETVSTTEIEDEMHGRPVRRLVSTVPAGSIEEAQALADIDQRRHDEISPPTRRRQRRAMRAHWSDRDNAIG